MLIVSGVYGNIASTLFSAVAADETNNITMGVLSAVSTPRNLVLLIMTPIMVKYLTKNTKLTMIVGSLFMTVPFFFQAYFNTGFFFYITGALLGIGGAAVA